MCVYRYVLVQLQPWPQNNFIFFGKKRILLVLYSLFTFDQGVFFFSGKLRKKENTAEKKGFLYISLAPPSCQKQGKYRNGNSLNLGLRWELCKPWIETELCKPWIETGTLKTLDRDGNSVNPGQRRELCKPCIETGTL